MQKTDYLTKLWNRESFEDRLRPESVELHERGMPISLLLIDVDCFAAYNRDFGHEMGDKCLVQIAQSIRSSVLCPNALVARYGGDEFAVLLPSTDEAQAINIAEGLRKNIADARVYWEKQHLASPTVSVGVATARDVADIKFLVVTADRYLYQAKQDGCDLVRGATVLK